MSEPRPARRPLPGLSHATLALVLGLGGACHGPDGPGDGGGGDMNGGGDMGGGGGDMSGGGDMNGGGDMRPGGLPCEVELLLSRSCASCHGTPLRGGAPMRLQTYGDLTARSMVDPSKTVAERSLARMKDAMRPMPPMPGPPVPAADLAAFEAWVTRGAPAGSCEPPDMGGGDMGRDMGGGDMPPPPSVCTSMTYWTRGNAGSSSMHPGMACIRCHSMGRGPSLSVAGTVYPTVREPDDCNGQSLAVVEITDAAGRVLTMTTNGAGNFRTGAALTLPIRARVNYMGRTRSMSGAVMSGDCNSCHTENGASGAPGRIMTP